MNKPGVLKRVVSKKMNEFDQIRDSRNMARKILKDRRGYGEREYLNSLPKTK